jgi:hypothetical protein
VKDVCSLSYYADALTTCTHEVYALHPFLYSFSFTHSLTAYLLARLQLFLSFYW